MSTTLVATPTKTPTTTTPASSTPSQSYQPSPGRFRHPRLTEIIERRSKTSFTTRNVHNAGVNVVALVLSLVLGDVLHAIVSTALTAVSISSSTLDAWLVILVIRLFLLINIGVALKPAMPYLSKQDNLDDIPLTPSQRALLGLPPSASSTPNSTQGEGPSFVTPPRYRRNSGISTPNSDFSAADRRSISANYSSSPLSTSRYTVGFSPSQQQQQQPNASSRSNRRASGSPFSPSPVGSPLLYKAVTQNSTFGGGNLMTSHNNASDFDVSRASFNTSTASGFGLSRSQSLRERMNGNGGGGDLDNSIGPGTPSPTGRRPATGGINYKWLYDKGGRLPKSDNVVF